MNESTDNERLKQQEVVPQQERPLTVADVDLDRMRRQTQYIQAESQAAQNYREGIANLEFTLAQTRSALSKQIMELRAENAQLKEQLILLTKQMEAIQSELAGSSTQQVENEQSVVECNGHVELPLPILPAPEPELPERGRRGGKRQK